MKVEDELHKNLYEIKELCKFVTLHPTVKLGKMMKLGHYVVIEEGCDIGDYCFIGNGCTLRPNVSVGPRTWIGHNTVIEESVTIGGDCRVQPLCHITRDVIIEEKVFIGPGLLSLNDDKMVHLRRDKLGFNLKTPMIRRGARIGAGVIIFPGVEIGENAVVGAGTLVTQNVAKGTMVFGSRGVVVRETPRDEWI